MNRRRKCVHVFLILCVVFVFTLPQCWGRRSSGGGSRKTGGYSRPSYTSYSRPSYSPPSHPSPSHSAPSHPSPSFSSPQHSLPKNTHHTGYTNNPSQSNSPTIGWNIPSYSPSSYPLSNNHHTVYGSNPSQSKPPSIGWNTPSHNPSPPVWRPRVSSSGTHQSGSEKPIGPSKTSSPIANGLPPSGNPGASRPIGLVDSAHSSSAAGTPNYHPSAPPHPGNKPSGNQPSIAPVGPPKHASNVGNSPPPYNPAGYGPPAYNSAGYGSQYGGGHPYQGGNPPGYYPQSGYHPGYHPQTGGAGGVTIINNNVNNNHHTYGGSYGGSYGGWAPSFPSYHYSSYDTGSTSLGFYLGYSLAKLNTPSYHVHNSYYEGSGYTPRYDHYTVHHYYHNNEGIPKEATIQPNAVVTCVGDGGSFCPSNTTPLCTNNGAVMCVASATTTVPCVNAKQTNCVKSTIPCVNNTSPECQGTINNTASISIPCISTAKIYGSVSYVNNTIVVSNSTVASTDLSLNGTMESNSINKTEVVLETTTNSTNIDISSLTHNNTENKVKEAPQSFCVTILALPAERKLSEGEKLYSGVKNVFNSFAVKVLGIA